VNECVLINLLLCMKQAQELYRESNGRQQVLPLDSIFKKALPEWNKSVMIVYFCVELCLLWLLLLSVM